MQIQCLQGSVPSVFFFLFSLRDFLATSATNLQHSNAIAKKVDLEKNYAHTYIHTYIYINCISIYTEKAHQINPTILIKKRIIVAQVI